MLDIKLISNIPLTVLFFNLIYLKLQKSQNLVLVST
jgi:hypothetical protein